MSLGGSGVSIGGVRILRVYIYIHIFIFALEVNEQRKKLETGRCTWNVETYC